jgi:hypothetical protein
MVEHLHRVSFSAERTPRIEMLEGEKKQHVTPTLLVYGHEML